MRLQRCPDLLILQIKERIRSACKTCRTDQRPATHQVHIFSLFIYLIQSQLTTNAENNRIETY